MDYVILLLSSEGPFSGGRLIQLMDWAKGYNFMLSKDTETNLTLMLVIGWNLDQTKMKAVGFNVKTGENIPPQI